MQSNMIFPDRLLENWPIQPYTGAVTLTGMSPESGDMPRSVTIELTIRNA